MSEKSGDIVPNSRELFNMNAYDEFSQIKEKIEYMIEDLKEEIYELYGYELEYDEIFLPNIHENIIKIN